MTEFKAHFKSVQPDLGGSLPGRLIFGIPGKDGGYYLVAAEQVDANTLRLTFTPSQDGMALVDPVDINLPGATDEQIQKIVLEYLAQNPPTVEEKDPTVPDWAKQPIKPKYTAKEVGAVATVNGKTPDENGNVEITIPDSGGNVDLTGYAKEQWVQQNYQPKGEYLTAVPNGYAKTEDIPTKPEDIGAQPAGNYALKDEMPVVPVQSVNGKTGAVQLNAADVGARPSNWMPTAQEVGALPDTYVPPNQTAAQVGADPAGTATAAVSTHNTSTDSHGDLRLELKAISDRLTAFFDSDNQTLDELSEIVAYITSNKALIDSITTSKVSVADIINNLTTNVANKPLSAAQGVALKGLIDAVSNSLSNYQPKGDYALRSELPAVPTKVSQLENDKGYLTEHQDISGKVDKVGLTLGRHADGLLYVFVDGQPVGNGVDLPAGGIDGYITPDKQIVFNNLPDGEYTLAYINDDGSIVPIGAMEKDTNVYYTVTNTLTNCTSNNSATQAVQGGSYSATISAKSGYELKSLTVTMGGSPVTVSGGVINIANVTGNIVITAVAMEVATTPKGNLADPTSADWQEGYRLSVGSGSTQPLDGHTTTNYIPCKAGNTLRVKGLGIHSTATSGGSSLDPKIVWYKTDKVKITGAFGTSAPNSSQCYGAQVSVDGDISTYTVAILNDGVQYANSACEWIRIDGFLMDGYTKNDVIITINEEIV